MGRGKSNVTTLHNATSISPSLRTTIPEHIALKLGLDSKIQVEWDIEKEDGVWCAKFKKKNVKIKKRIKNK